MFQETLFSFLPPLSLFVSTSTCKHCVYKYLFLVPWFQPGFSYWWPEGECQRAGHTETLEALSFRVSEAWKDVLLHQGSVRKEVSCHDEYSREMTQQAANSPQVPREFLLASSIKHACYNSIRGKALEKPNSVAGFIQLSILDYKEDSYTVYIRNCKKIR